MCRKMDTMQDIPPENPAPESAPPVDRRKIGLRPPVVAGGPGLPGAGRPRKGTGKLARMFATRSRNALTDAGITLPPGARITVEHYAELCRVHAVEAVECLAWIVRQRGRSHQWGGLAAAAASDLLKFGYGAPDQRVEVSHSGTVTHQHAAAVNGAFLDAALGRAAIEGEVIHNPAPIEHNARYAQLPDISTGYAQILPNAALPAVDNPAQVQGADAVPADDLAGAGIE